MATSNAILQYEQLQQLILQIYEDIKKKSNIEHNHLATDITENSSKRFVSDSEKNSWNAKITQAQLDGALNSLTSGLSWKGSFSTLTEIQAIPNPQDGWFTIKTSGENVFYIYESSTNSWQDLGGLMLPGVATSTANGLMTKEMVNKLAQLHNYTLPKASASILGGVKSGSIITIGSDGDLQIDTSKVISSAERTKWNKAGTDATEALNKIANTDANLASAVQRVSSVETRTTALEGKMTYISSADIETLVEVAKK